MSVNIFGSENNLIKPYRGPPEEGFKFDIEGNYDMQNKWLANVATSVENCDIVTRGEVDKHEELFKNLIVINSTSGRHDGKLKQLEDKITSISDKLLINLSNHKHAQSALLRKIRENISMHDNKTSGF